MYQFLVLLKLACISYTGRAFQHTSFSHAGVIINATNKVCCHGHLLLTIIMTEVAMKRKKPQTRLQRIVCTAIAAPTAGVLLVDLIMLWGYSFQIVNNFYIWLFESFLNSILIFLVFSTIICCFQHYYFCVCYQKRLKSKNREEQKLFQLL